MLDRDYDMELDHIDFLLHVNEEEGETHLDSSTKVHLDGLLLFRAVEKNARKRERKDCSTKVHPIMKTDHPPIRYFADFRRHCHIMDLRVICRN